MASSHEFPTEGTIYLMLPMGSKVCIGLIDNDGEVTVTFTDRELKIEADMPDSDGRVGEIYSERFADDFENHAAEMKAAGKEEIEIDANLAKLDDEEDDPRLPTKTEFDKLDEMASNNFEGVQPGEFDGPFTDELLDGGIDGPYNETRGEMGVFEDFEGMDSGIDTTPKNEDHHVSGDDVDLSAEEAEQMRKDRKEDDH